MTLLTTLVDLFVDRRTSNIDPTFIAISANHQCSELRFISLDENIVSGNHVVDGDAHQFAFFSDWATATPHPSVCYNPKRAKVGAENTWRPGARMSRIR